MGFIYSQLFVTPAYPTTSFKGQTVIVTGSNVGLGKEAARHFARLGVSKLILAVRNITAGEEARQDIISTEKCSLDTIEVWELDLSKYSSVQAFARKADNNLDRIDAVIENAAIATDKYEDAEGHERSITVNVVSTFLLAFLLLPKLEATAKKFKAQPRLTIVTSEVHAWTKFAEWKNDAGVFVTLDGKDTAKMNERYMTSKLLEILALRQIAPKVKERGVILNCLNPGLCHSELARDAGWGVYVLKMLLARSTEIGGRTLVAAAAAGEESHGKYMTDGLVEDEALSPFVRSDDGDKAAEKVWGELKDILEGVQKGVTAGF